MSISNKVKPEDVQLIKGLLAKGASERDIANLVGFSTPTVQRVAKGYYNDQGVFLGAPPKEEPTPEKASEEPKTDLEWLKDAMAKLLYEQCLTNSRLKELIEKWK